MIDQKIISLLYEIPSDLDQTEILEDLDIEDIPLERIEQIKSLLQHNDSFVVFQAARLLTNWGVEEGFVALTDLLERGQLKGEIDHRLRGYDDTLQHVLSALIGFWATKSDAGEGDITQKRIYKYVAAIIDASNKQPFEISCLFWSVKAGRFGEYLPLLKEHLAAIIDFPELHHWKIYDVIELLLTVDSEFVHDFLRVKQKSLSDFGFLDNK